jgi:hypothetical protein
MNGPQKSQEDEPGIKLATQKGGKNNNREVIIRYDLLFAILWGVYLLFLFVFFPDKKKREKGDLLKKNFQCYTIGFFFVVC